MPDSEDILNNIDKYDDCVIITYDAQNYKKQISLFNEIINKKETYVISLKGPIDLKHYDNIKNYLCLYEYTPVSINTMVKYVNGMIKPNGVLPVKVSKRIPVGASIYLGLKDYTLYLFMKNFLHLHIKRSIPTVIYFKRKVIIYNKIVNI